MTRFFMAIFVLLGMTLSVAGAASNCYARVNGVCLDPSEIGALEQRACAPIPIGSYWLDSKTGVWGYQGGPVQGQLGGAYSNDRHGTRTPGGDIIDDCYYDPRTGCSVCPRKGLIC
jgi:hypothetical protein